jgi:hypothetical protein
MQIKRTQSGQVVLITLLVLTIATTVALSLISRTTTDTAITAQAEESSRAFSAAEAGIEEALKSGVSVGPTGIVGISGVQYQVSVSSIGDAVGVYEFPRKTSKGTTETLWLASHLADGSIDEDNTLSKNYRASSIDLCWTREATMPALAVTVLYKESSPVLDPYRVAKIAIDPDSLRTPTNGFTSDDSMNACDGGTSKQYIKRLVFSTLSSTLDSSTDTLIALRVRPLYSDTTISVDAGGTLLPQQGKSIASTGSTSSGTNRKIVVYQQYRAPATIFDAALYSQGSVDHSN